MSIQRVLSDLAFVVSQESSDVGDIYDRAAERYEHFRDLWLKIVGEHAERAMLQTIQKVIGPSWRVLDAGAGTGALSRQTRNIEPAASITMVDVSENMLRHASDESGERVRASVLQLPFGNDVFDLVVSGWVIDTVPDPRQAVREFLRVINPQGYVIYTFCSLPDGWLSRAGSSFLRKAVRKGFAGHFLDRTEEPWHDCSESRITRFHGGLSTLVVLRKCCHVEVGVLPKRDLVEGTKALSQR